MVQWLRLHASNAGSMGSIPGGGTKIPHIIGMAKSSFKKLKQRNQIIDKQKGYIVQHKEIQSLFCNNFKWSIIYKNIESPCCTPI